MISNFRLADPGFQSLILACQVTMTGLLGAAFWIIFKPPEPVLILIVPWLLALVLDKLRTRKNTLWVFFLSSANVAVGCFIFAALHDAKVLILLFLFVYTFLNFASSEYRPVGTVAAVLGTMSTAQPGGWYSGVNYAILVGIASVIVLVVFFSFSQVFCLSIRSVLRVLMEQVTEAIKRCVDPDAEKAVSDDFEKGKDGEYSATALKANLLIRKTTYTFPTEKRLEEKASAVLFHLRMLMADRAMMRGFFHEKERLSAFAPSSAQVVKGIHSRLDGALSAFLTGKGPVPHEDEPAYEAWRKEIEARRNPPDPSFSNVFRIVYGMECALIDLTRLETAIYEMNHSPTITSTEEDRAGFLRELWNRMIAPWLKMRGRPGDPDKSPSHPKPVKSPSAPPPEIQRGIYQDAFKAATAITFAMFLWKAMHLPHGYWLLMTVSILFMGGNQGHILQRLGHRLIGTTIGIFLAFFFVRDFLGQDFVWAYTLPVILFFFFYIYFLTGNYAYLVVLVTLFVGVLLSTLEGSGSQMDFFLAGTLFNRFVCTLMAGMIVAIVVSAIFPHANRSADIMERTLSSHWHDLTSFIKVLVNRYPLGQALTGDEWVMLNTIREKYASTEQLHHWMQYEIYVDEHYDSLYKTSRLGMERLFSVMSCLICIVCHPRKTLFSKDEKRAIQLAGAGIFQMLGRLEVGKMGLAEAGPENGAALQVRPLSDEELQTRFFVWELERFSEILDQLMHHIEAESRPPAVPGSSALENR